MKINLNMNPGKRLHYILLASIGLLLIGLAAGAYGANALLTSRADKLTALKAKSQAQAQEQISFINAKKEIKQYAGLQKITQAVVPADKDQAQAVREIVNIAAANGVSLTSITFPASTLGAGISGNSTGSAGTPAQAAPAAGSSKTESGAGTGKLSQVTPVKNIPGVYSLLITVQSDSSKPVPYHSFISFLSALEHNRRTAQINTIILQPKANNRDLLTFTLTLNEYIKP